MNSHIKKNKLKKTDLLDNSAIYLDLDDFKELFKRIRFEINQNELNGLFKYKNNSYDEGYLFGKNFLENINIANFTQEDNIYENVNYGNIEIKDEIDERKNRIKKVDFNEINNQLKIIQNEVNDIVKKNKSVGKNKIASANKPNYNPFDSSRKFSARNISSRNDISSSNTSDMKTSNLISNQSSLILN